MLPSLNRGYEENVSTILNVHMNSCNKAAIILPRPMAIHLHKTLQRLGKPSHFGKDVITERFTGYKFFGHFPANVVFRAGYLFEANLFEFWQKIIEHLIALKARVNDTNIFVQNTKHANLSEESVRKSTIAILTIIPGIGLVLSVIYFILFEKLHLQNKVIICIDWFIIAKTLYHDFPELAFQSTKSHLKHKILIKVQPKMHANK